MLNRFAALAACTLLPLGTAPLALADPARPTTPGRRRTPAVASDEPAVVTTPDGWVLTVAATTRPSCRSRR